MGEERISIQDALFNVQLLDDIQLSDDQPGIEANSMPLRYRASFDTHFEDTRAFITGCSKYIEETTRQAQFNEILQQGFVHASHLYTWRCCSRVVPMPRSNDQQNRLEINEKIIQVLEPEVRKLDAFMQFTLAAIDTFVGEFQSLCHPEKRKDFISESLLLTLGKLLNMFAILDALKDMKASIKNDLSTFHRASQFPQHGLILFLATQNRIKQTLREKVQKIEANEELLADLINISAHFYENKLYITPEEKYTHIKVMAFCIFLMDMDTYLRLDQKKRISLQKLDKIFKSIEVVPLFGDMNILPFMFVKQCHQPDQCGPSNQCKCYDPSKWPLSNTESEKCHIDIAEKLSQSRENHDKFVTNLSRIRNEFAVYNRSGPLNDLENKEIVNMTLNGLQMLCEWTCNVIETVAWKLLRPTNHRRNPECPENAEIYELATKYNYNNEEKAAIVEFLSMIKGVQSLMMKLESDFLLAIRQHIYIEMQDFISGPLRDLLNKAVKHKKDMLSGIVTAIIETCSDQVAEGDTLNKYNSKSSDLTSIKPAKKSKKGVEAESLPDLRIKSRTVVPSNTQLYLARAMLESLVHEKSTSSGRRVYRKDLDEKYREKMVHFLRSSFFWPDLLELQQSLERSADLSQLWFREFYLEMAMGTRIQFPIDMSLPWILIDHVLSSLNPALLECLLYQLDLYNDAAIFALRHFKKQFLYDEIEAEVNLCFDQFVFKLSEAIFVHYKQIAATLLLDKAYKADCTNNGINIRTPSATRFESLFRQRHLQLLGRSIDLNRLVSQRINAAMIRTLESAISKFESEHLQHIMILNDLIEVNKLCHRLLSEQLGFLADFNDLFAEANHQVSVPNGRITLHIFTLLTDDLIPNYCFNTTTRRFVRGKINYRKMVDRRPPLLAPQYEFGSKSLNAAFTNLSIMFNGFIGIPHFRVLAKLIGYQGIAAILGDLLCLARRLLNEQLKTHYKMLLGLAPKECKLQRFDYGLDGNLQYFIHKLRDFSSYPHLRSEFCQSLREFGNILALVLELELGLAQEEMSDLLSATAFAGQIPKPHAKTLEEQELKMRKLEAKYSRLQIASVTKQMGTDMQREIASESELLTRERLCCGLNIFEMVLNRLRDSLLTDPIWKGPTASNGVMLVDECAEFYRIWSGFLFILSLTQMQPQQAQSTQDNSDYGTLRKGALNEDYLQNFSVEEKFGDGIYWAGCAIIRLLSQHRRFEVLDFGYHLLRVNRVSQNQRDKELREGNQVGQFIDRLRRVQALNNQIFILINNHVGQLEINEEQNIRHFAPPVYQPQQWHGGNGLQGSAL